MKKFLYGLTACLFACTPEINYEAPECLDDLRVLIISEGQFGYGTSSLNSFSYYGTVEQDLFRRINNRPLGEVAHPATRIRDLFSVPLNNSMKVAVM